MQSSKEKTEPTSASGLGKWAEDGTGACTGERPDGCLPGARAERASARPKRWIVAVAAVAYSVLRLGRLRAEGRG